MHAKSLISSDDVARQTPQENRVGRITVLAVLWVLSVGLSVIGGSYEGHLRDTTPMVAVPWSIR